MTRKRQDATWPLVGILALFLILSAVSPRTWDRFARPQAAADTAAETPAAVEPAPLKLPPILNAPQQAVPEDWQPATATPHVGRQLRVWDADDPVVEVPDRLGEAAAPREMLFGPRLSDAGAESSDADVESRIPLMANTPAHRPPLSLPQRLPPPPQKRVASTDESSLAPVLDPTIVLPSETLEPPRRLEPPMAQPQRPWREPTALIERLHSLQEYPATEPWSRAGLKLIDSLADASTRSPQHIPAILEQLEDHCAAVLPLADALGNPPLASELRRAGHALYRRIVVWREVVPYPEPPRLMAADTTIDGEQLALALNDVEQFVGDTQAGKAWREYLLVDSLRDSLRRRQDPEDEDTVPWPLLNRVLERIASQPFSDEQQQFVESRPIARLREHLLHLASRPVQPTDILERLEQYEDAGNSSDAETLAAEILRMRYSSEPQQQRLAERFQQQYRNANLRFSVAGDLLNRMVPERDPEYGNVYDTVLGVPVRGRSVTSSDVQFRLIPDSQRIRLALEVSGKVASLTSATSGPATFYSDSMATYMGIKPIIFDARGIHLLPANVQVLNNSRLRAVKTTLDPIPLIGSLAKEVARSQHEQKAPEANREVQQKIAARARAQIDDEANARLQQVSQRMRQRVVEPLQTMELIPTVIDAETTEERVTMRLRLADEGQLGGHTPRPRAPSSSLASLQIHESAMNNLLSRLELDGKTFTLPELAQHVDQRLGQPGLLTIDPINDDVTITFAAKDALLVRCQDGRLSLTLAIARLRKPPRSWRDFKVQAFYQPEIQGRLIELARDGVVQLSGQRLRFSSQIALRGIFSKTFSKDESIKLSPERFLNNPKVADLRVSQFVIDDGWIGVALGPKPRAAQREQVVR